MRWPTSPCARWALPRERQTGVVTPSRTTTKPPSRSAVAETRIVVVLPDSPVATDLRPRIVSPRPSHVPATRKGRTGTWAGSVKTTVTRLATSPRGTSSTSLRTGGTTGIAGLRCGSVASVLGVDAGRVTGSGSGAGAGTGVAFHMEAVSPGAQARPRDRDLPTQAGGGLGSGRAPSVSDRVPRSPHEVRAPAQPPGPAPPRLRERGRRQGPGPPPPALPRRSGPHRLAACVSRAGSPDAAATISRSIYPRRRRVHRAPRSRSPRSVDAPIGTCNATGPEEAGSTTER